MSKLQLQKDAYITGVFWFGLQICFIFGGPAILGVFVGKSLDAWLDTFPVITIITLVITFTSSWAIVLFKYRQLNKKMKEMHYKVEEDSDKSQSDT